jgi:hypothetical protein
MSTPADDRVPSVRSLYGIIDNLRDRVRVLEAGLALVRISLSVHSHETDGSADNTER